MKLYVLIDKRLSNSQRAVQGAHAVAEWLIHRPNSVAKQTQGPLVLLKVDSLSPYLHKDHEGFYEPDLGWELTAIATLDGRRLEREKLL